MVHFGPPWCCQWWNFNRWVWQKNYYGGLSDTRGAKFWPILFHSNIVCARGLSLDRLRQTILRQDRSNFATRDSHIVYFFKFNVVLNDVWKYEWISIHCIGKWEQEFLEFRANCNALWSYHWVSIPMVIKHIAVVFDTTVYWSLLNNFKIYTQVNRDDFKVKKRTY